MILWFYCSFHKAVLHKRCALIAFFFFFWRAFQSVFRKLAHWHTHLLTTLTVSFIGPTIKWFGLAGRTWVSRKLWLFMTLVFLVLWLSWISPFSPGQTVVKVSLIYQVLSVMCFFFFFSCVSLLECVNTGIREGFSRWSTETLNQMHTSLSGGIVLFT